MATGKRFYWIKLKESFMTSDTVDYLMSQPNGANYVVLYQMLCLKTINTGGKLSRQIGEVLIPYDVEKIKRDCKWFSEDTIRVALNLFRSFGLVYEDRDGTLILTDHNSLVGSETDYAEKNRKMRAQQAALLESGHIVSSDVSADLSETVSTENREKREENREKRIEIISFTQSNACAREEDNSQEEESADTEYPDPSKYGKTELERTLLGKYNNVMLSDAQMDDLLEVLSLEEIKKYIAIVSNCEQRGKCYTNKTHYQAILDMAMKDRKVQRRKDKQ